MASAVTFDTHAAVRSLRQAGFDETQAEAAVGMVRDAVNESVATKVDIAAVKAEIAAVKAEIAALKNEMGNLRAEAKADVAALETRLTVRMYTAIGIGVAVLVAVQKLL